MSWPVPSFSRTEVNRAGETLRSGSGERRDEELLGQAMAVLSNWRSSHGYPINTFQATLRDKVKRVGGRALVAQRLKRTPSIVGKLRRFPKMNLARMQDIGGLRAVVRGIREVRELEGNYLNSRFLHKLVKEDDYISEPKQSGYRGVHLVYRYANPRAQSYDGLFVELQIRTRRQHTWATAVETMGLFLDRALKSSQGPEEWLQFFALTGAAFAHVEDSAPVPGYERSSALETFEAVAEATERLRVREHLSAFSLAARHVQKDRGSYHLVVLDFEEKLLHIDSYSRQRLDEATSEYTSVEQRIAEGAPLQVVLVSTDSTESLRRAYPSYFLDTRSFLRELNLLRLRARKGR